MVVNEIYQMRRELMSSSFQQQGICAWFNIFAGDSHCVFNIFVASDIMCKKMKKWRKPIDKWNKRNEKKENKGNNRKGETKEVERQEKLNKLWKK